MFPVNNVGVGSKQCCCFEKAMLVFGVINVGVFSAVCKVPSSESCMQGAQSNLPAKTGQDFYLTAH